MRIIHDFNFLRRFIQKHFIGVSFCGCVFIAASCVGPEQEVYTMVYPGSEYYGIDWSTRIVRRPDCRAPVSTSEVNWFRRQIRAGDDLGAAEKNSQFRDPEFFIERSDGAKLGFGDPEIALDFSGRLYELKTEVVNGMIVRFHKLALSKGLPCTGRYGGQLILHQRLADGL
jgi:hypothetical protein